MAMNKEKSLDYVNLLVKNGTLVPFRTTSYEFFCEVSNDEGREIYSIYSKSLQLAIKTILKEKYNVTVSTKSFLKISEKLEEIAFQNTITYKLSQRVYGNSQKLIYDLGGGKSVKMQNGIVKLIKTPRLRFLHHSTFQCQVQPNLDVNPTELPSLLGKVFHLKDEKEILLMTVYVVSCFAGAIINIPILLLSGEKGSSKSTVLRRLEKIIDPKTIDLGGAPRSLDILELRMNNNYFLTLDNMSKISWNISDCLCRGCTGGSATRRRLYCDTEEIVLDLRCIIAINGVSVVAKESDLIDRCLIFKLSRIPKDEIRTEQELEQEFKNLLPDILGCCFKLIAEALNDKEPIMVKEKIRLCDFFDMAIKIGRALGYDDSVISSILWDNQKNVNGLTINESVVAQCVIALMNEYTEYKASVSELLGDLKIIAENNHIHPSQMPKQPNQLSKQLNLIKENLAQEYGIIVHDTKNVGPFKEIYIECRN